MDRRRALQKLERQRSALQRKLDAVERQIQAWAEAPEVGTVAAVEPRTR